MFESSAGSEQRGGGEKTVMRLSCNGVRKARSDATLGYVPPSALHRGLSVGSLVEGEAASGLYLD